MTCLGGGQTEVQTQGLDSRLSIYNRYDRYNYVAILYR